MDALSGIPEVEKPLLVGKGEAKLQKTDIFRKIMWFSYDDENNWYPVSTDRVTAVIALNKAGKRPATLLEDVIEEVAEDASSNSDLIAMDKKYSKNKKRKHNKNRNRNHPKNNGKKPTPPTT
jgi:hypothetical protein